MISNFAGKERDAQYTNIYMETMTSSYEWRGEVKPGESNRAFAHSLKLEYQVDNEPIRMQTDPMVS